MNLGNLKRWSLLALVCLLVVGSICINFSTASVTTAKAPTLVKPDQSQVAIVQAQKDKAKDLTYTDIKTMVKEAVNLGGGLKGLVKSGSTVVIKPNLVSTTHYMDGNNTLESDVNGNTTDWRVTKAVVELVRELNPKGKVYVMEGSATDT